MTADELEVEPLLFEARPLEAVSSAKPELAPQPSVASPTLSNLM